MTQGQLILMLHLLEKELSMSRFYSDFNPTPNEEVASYEDTLINLQYTLLNGVPEDKIQQLAGDNIRIQGIVDQYVDWKEVQKTQLASTSLDV